MHHTKGITCLGEFPEGTNGMDTLLYVPSQSTFDNDQDRIQFVVSMDF